MTTTTNGRTAGWLAAGILSTAALLAPATAIAAGPGSDDHLPNSGTASSAGGVVPTMVANATISCDEAE